MRDHDGHVPARGTQEEGFTPLFNGKDLTGWVYGRRSNGTENRTGKGYQVENGIIFSTKGGPAKRGFQKPLGEWNTQEITANGRRITVVLNGMTIVDANLDDVKDEALLAKHRDLTRPEGSRGIANTRGHIGLLGHGTRVEFRNIRIKEL